MVSSRTIYSVIKTSLLYAMMFFVFGCASYHNRITDYYQKLGSSQFDLAEKALDKNALLQKPRNLLLFYMEKGRVAHLKGEYEASNKYFNQADLLVEDGLSTTGDIAVGLFLNSMSQNYKGEEFEIFMLHYYKALNYMYLGQTNEAIVEARRISLQNYAQGDKYKDKSTRYSKDAFSLNIQGLIYEYSGNYNDAFISYRNAVETYQSSKDGMYYGVAMPTSLKYDVIRMAAKIGFSGDVAKYERDFNLNAKDIPSGSGGEVVIFWENGRAPIKEQDNLYFTLAKGDSGSLVFTNALGFIIPLDFGIAGKTNLNDIHSVNIAYPKYIVQPMPFNKATVLVNDSKQAGFEKVEDLDALAVLTLKERAGKELGQILTRVAVKKAAEYAVKAAAKSNGKDGDANALLEGIGLGVQLFNFFSEKADTRNWQTLPAQINYSRVPLELGQNKLKITMERPNGQRIEHNVEINGTGKMQFYNFATMK
ncbi:MAG: COG3014 family protein [Flavobacterium sp.]